MGLGCLPEWPALALPTAYRPAYHRRGPLGTLGVKTDPSSWTGVLEMGSLSLFVRQRMSSVLGTEKPTPSLDPLVFSLAYCFCSIWMLRR